MMSYWTKNMVRIGLGFVLGLFMVNLYGVNLILPLAGQILILLGCYALRKQNASFGTAWKWSMVSTLLGFVFLSLTVSATGDTLMTVLFAVYTCADLALLLYIGKALYAVQKKSGLKAQLGGIVFLVLVKIAELFSCVGMVHWNSTTDTENATGAAVVALFVGGIAFYFWMKMVRTVEQAGFVAFAYSGKGFVKIMTSACLVGFVVLFAVSACFTAMPMSWTEATDIEYSEDSTYQDALNLGVPKDILDDLDAQGDEVRLFQDAAELQQTDSMLSVKRNLFGSKSDFQVRTIAVKDSAESYVKEDETFSTWYVIQYFNWSDDMHFCGTNCISVEFPLEDESEDTDMDTKHYIYYGDMIDTSCVLLYDKDGKTYATQAYPSGSWGESHIDGMKAYLPFSLPNGGENYRGYILYQITSHDPDFSVDVRTRFLNQTAPCYSYRTAEDELSNLELSWKTVGPCFSLCEDIVTIG